MPELTEWDVCPICGGGLRWRYSFVSGRGSSPLQVPICDACDRAIIAIVDAVPLNAGQKDGAAP